MSKKQNDILEAAQKLFFKYGVKKVTIEEVCVEANVSKMTFYKYFHNKTELTKKVLDHFFQSRMDKYLELMDMDIPFSEKMKKALQIKREGSTDASKDFLVDLFRHPDSELAAYINCWYEHFIKKTVEIFEEAKKQGHIRKDVNPILLLALFEKIDDICVDDRVLNAYGNVADLAEEIAKLILYGVCEK